MERARRENVAEKERLEQSRENEEFTFREVRAQNSLLRFLIGKPTIFRRKCVVKLCPINRQKFAE